MENSTSPQTSPFIPLTLIGAAVIILMVWQLLLAWNTRSNLRTQFEQRKILVQQSEVVQGNVQSLISDLLNLAETDPQAKAIVTKYKIQRSAPAGN